jgi:hypothetical protein
LILLNNRSIKSRAAMNPQWPVAMSLMLRLPLFGGVGDVAGLRWPDLMAIDPELRRRELLVLSGVI